jgi:hypothetical protein
MPAPRPFPLLLLLAALAVPAAARADDEPESVTEKVDVSRYRLPAAPGGALLMAPSDRGAQDQWTTARAGDPGVEADVVWREFSSPALDREGVSGNAVIELLHSWNAPLVDSIGSNTQGETIVLTGPPEKVAEARRTTEWLLGALGPSLSVHAVLTAHGGEPRVFGASSATLWPGRWTRVLFQETRTPFVVEADIEIAQEVVSMEPHVEWLPQGEELYLRYHPGEAVSVVEVWAASLEHLETLDLDLSELRNVPESNAPPHLSLPRTAIRRSFTAFVVPTGEEARRGISWEGPGGGRRLSLQFGKGPAAVEAKRTASGDLLSILRSGAWSETLEFDSRPGQVDAFMEAVGVQGSLQTMNGAALLVHVGGEREAARVRAAAKKREEALEATLVSLRTLVVPEEALRKALEAGKAVVGAPIDAAVLETFRQAGSEPGEAVRMPVLAGMHAGFRVGASVTGLRRVDAEVAQQAGGLDPVSAAAFAGLSASVSVDRTATGRRLVLDGAYAWADPRAGSMKLVFRPPVGMRYSESKPQAEPDLRRVAELPVMGDGRRLVESSIDVPAAEKREFLLAAVLRGAEAVLLLASLE